MNFLQVPLHVLQFYFYIVQSSVVYSLCLLQSDSLLANYPNVFQLFFQEYYYLGCFWNIPEMSKTMLQKYFGRWIFSEIAFTLMTFEISCHRFLWKVFTFRISMNFHSDILYVGDLFFILINEKSFWKNVLYCIWL